MHHTPACNSAHPARAGNAYEADRAACPSPCEVHHRPEDESPVQILRLHLTAQKVRFSGEAEEDQYGEGQCRFPAVESGVVLTRSCSFCVEELKLRHSLYADEIQWLLWDKFEVWVSVKTVLLVSIHPACSCVAWSLLSKGSGDEL